MKLFDAIRSAGEGAIVADRAAEAGVDRGEAKPEGRGMRRCPSVKPCVAAGIVIAVLFEAAPIAAVAQVAPAYPVGIRQLDYVDAEQGGRHLALWLFYPAVIDQS
ncbi:MAG: hypothetical protein ACREJ0_29270, partial [Geminicoccaceae bacterium]